MAVGLVPEVLEVKGLLDGRLKSLSYVKKTMLMNSSAAEYVLNAFIDSSLSFMSIAGSTEKEFVKQELEKIQNLSISPIPVSEIEGHPAIAVMHNKFKSISAAVFSSDYLPAFFRNIVAEGCAESANNGLGFINNILSLKGKIQQHAAEIGQYLQVLENTPSKDLPQKIIENGPGIIAAAEGMYLSTVKVFNGMKNKNAVSENLVNQVMANADNLLDLIGTEGVKNPALSAANINSYLTMVDEISYQEHDLKSYARNLLTMDSEFKNLDLGKIFNDNFKSLLGNGNQVLAMSRSIVDAAKSGNITAMSQTVRTIMSGVSALKGQLGQLKQNNLKNIFNLDTILQTDFNGLKNMAENFINSFPNEIMRSFKADVQAIVGITNQLLMPLTLTNAKRRPKSQDIIDIATRIGTKGDTITSHTTNFINGLTGFSKSTSVAAATAVDALKKVAPTPVKMLALGNVSTFKKVFDNPMLLTKIGVCQEAISKAMKDDKITNTQAGLLNSILGFVSGEHEREIQTSVTCDTDLQKSMAVQGLDSIIENEIVPMQLTLEKYIKATGDR